MMSYSSKTPIPGLYHKISKPNMPLRESVMELATQLPQDATDIKISKIFR
jgi:hypothetical protein